jgi:acetoin utilization protein AcuB
MKLDSIMKTEVVTVGMDASLISISRMFEEGEFHHVLVTEDNELCGVISERDLLRASSPFLNTPCEQNRDLATLRKRAHQLMSRKPITITAEATPGDAVQLMLQKGISCLPVVSSDDQLVGIVTWKDLLRAYSQHAYAGRRHESAAMTA